MKEQKPLPSCKDLGIPLIPPGFFNSRIWLLLVLNVFAVAINLASAHLNGRDGSSGLLAVDCGCAALNAYVAWSLIGNRIEVWRDWRIRREMLRTRQAAMLQEFYEWREWKKQHMTDSK
jgi:hypothetical protein